MLQEGVGHYKACRALGIKSAVVKQRIEIDSDFAEQAQDAEEEFLESLEEKYLENAKLGDNKALADILTKRYNRRWAEKPTKVELTGNIVTDISALPIMEQIAALYKVLDERARLRSGEQILEISSAEALSEED